MGANVMVDVSRIMGTCPVGIQLTWPMMTRVYAPPTLRDFAVPAYRTQAETMSRMPPM